MTDPRITNRTKAYRAARDAWHAAYCGEDRACTPGDHCEGAPDRKALQAALGAALAHLAPQPVVDREQIAKAIHDAVWPNCPNEHVIFADGTEGDAADAVLALINGSVS
jgi:hypothetical protein